jgi:GntR family transcriptional regulator/MocR family aminotransferase
VAFVLIPERFHNAFSMSHWLAETVPSVLSQRLVLNYFAEGFFDEDVLRVTQAARLRRKSLLSALQTWPSNLIRYDPVKAGFHQSVWFNQDIDDLRVFEMGLANGIGIVPLSAYFRSDNAASGMSLSFAQINEEKIQAGLEQLLPIVQGCR